VNLHTDTRASRRTYKWYTGKSVYEFGYGMHYTNFTATMSTPLALNANFSTASLVANPPSAAPHKDLLPFAHIPVHAANTGATASDYVALLFLRGEYGPKPYPLKSLVGYARIRGVVPGASGSETVEISLGAIARADEKGDLVLWPGKYSLVLDVEERQTWNFTISGEPVVLDAMPAHEREKSAASM
jgi:xylan 1,4-beta-xylosidase